jgi:hypothetical protein
LASTHQRQFGIALTVIFLKMQLLDLNKGTQSVDTYLRHAKSIDDALISINKPILDEDLVIATLHGLGPNYLMLHTVLT